MIAKREATIEDLYKINEKAEIVCGEIKYLMATGDEPGWAGDEIYSSLRDYMKRRRLGVLWGTTKGSM